MGRPSRHGRDQLLDTAVALVAQGGPGDLTMAGVARAAGAPSGSVYHRFPGRSSLLAALWLRTVERFQEGYLATVERGAPPQAAVDAARHVVAWCRAHPREARVLSYGPDALDRGTWPEEDRRSLEGMNRRVLDALRALAARADAGPASDPERLVLVAVDLPYATVRRHLVSGEPIPASTEGLVAECAAAVLSSPAPRDPPAT